MMTELVDLTRTYDFCLLSDASVTVTPASVCGARVRVWRRDWCVAVSTTPPAPTVRSVCPSTTTGRGGAPPTRTLTSACVSVHQDEVGWLASLLTQSTESKINKHDAIVAMVMTMFGDPLYKQ